MAMNGSETDVGWYLYNVRYAVDVCLFSSPGKSASNSSTSSPCILSGNCLPLKENLETGDMKPDNETEYQYCTASSGAFGGTQLNNCVECLQTNTPQSYLSNCDLLGLNGTLFSTVAMTIVTPSWNQTQYGAATSVTSLNTGTIVGIAVGGGLLVLGAIVLFYIYWRKQKRAKNNPFSDYQRDNDQYRQVKSISSSFSGSTVPFYTTDYKSPPADQRNFELYDKIKTQHVVIPEGRRRDAPTPGTGALWGRDTPMPTRQQLLSPQMAGTPMSQSITSELVGQPLDGMPTHPAFIPRAFTRGSRNPMGMPDVKPATKSNKPDTYAIQRYLDTLNDTSNIDVKSLLSAPLPKPSSEQTRTTVVSVSSNPFATPQGTPLNIPPPPPGPPPASKFGPGSQNNGPKLTPSLVAPSLSRIRSPKMYIPPPLDITKAKPKAHRLNSDSDEPK
ncbi:hypothetical protein SCUCBS95973_005362 [Sporothrix curviconia]|uniref:Lpxtg-domain-containing protein n=1 Tax=Sporothrix curviconia TaxID=1260050 RepID=A0ABP0BW35_9PEZI